MKDVLITLSKHYETHSIGTLQVFDGDNEGIALYCLALPYKDNQRDISRIKDGAYPAEILEESTRFKYPHVYIKFVEGRSDIKIHILNSHTETHGCFGVGLGFDKINKTLMQSEKALRFLINSLRGFDFRVIVKTV